MSPGEQCRRTSIFHSLCGPGVPRVGNAFRLAGFVRVDESDSDPFGSAAQLDSDIQNDQRIGTYILTVYVALPPLQTDTENRTRVSRGGQDLLTAIRDSRPANRHSRLRLDPCRRGDGHVLAGEDRMRRDEHRQNGDPESTSRREH